MKIQVYYNLKKEIFSIKYNTLVLGYANSLILENVELKVNGAGRLKVLAEKRKNVHAFAVGDLLAIDNNSEFYLKEDCQDKEAQLNLLTFLNNQIDKKEFTKQLTYNPYKYKTFVEKITEKPCQKVNQALLTNKQILAK